MTPEDLALVDELMRRMYVDLYSVVRAALAAMSEATRTPQHDFHDLLADYMAPRRLELEVEGTHRYRMVIGAPPTR